MQSDWSQAIDFVLKNGSSGIPGRSTLAGATVNADFSDPVEQAAITAQYVSLKAAIVNAYNLMP